MSDNINNNNNKNNERHYEYDSGGKKSPYMLYIICGTIVAGLGLGLAGIVTIGSITTLNTYDRVNGIIIGTSSCGESCSKNKNNGVTSCSTSYAAIVEYEVDGSIYEFTTSSCR